MSGPRTHIASSHLTLKDHHHHHLHLIVSVCRGVAGEPDGGPGQGAAAGQHEWGFQLVLLHVALNKTSSRINQPGRMKGLLFFLSLTSSERI